MIDVFGEITYEFLVSCAQNKVLIEEITESLSKKWTQAQKYTGSKFERNLRIRFDKKEIDNISILTEEEKECQKNWMLKSVLKTRFESLFQMGFMFQITILEGYIKKILKNVLIQNPHIMKQFSSKLEVGEILNCNIFDDILIKIASNEVEKWGYDNIDEMQKKIDKIFKFNLPSFKDWDKLKEFYYLRNILVHNNGIINEIFIEKVPKSKYKLKEKVDLTIDVFLECYKSIHAFINYLYDEIVKKFKLVKLPLLWNEEDKKGLKKIKAILEDHLAQMI